MFRRSSSKPPATCQPLALWAMDLTIVGCSGSFPGPDSAASCYLIEADGFRLVLDLGNGALGSLQRYAALEHVDAVFLSHLHADHCLDMCSYQVFRAYNPAGLLPPIPVYGPAGAQARLQRAATADPAARGTPISDVFDFMTLTPGNFGIGPFAVTLDHVNHPVETFGFRLEYGGPAIAYSADTRPSEQPARLADGGHVLLCGAAFRGARR